VKKKVEKIVLLTEMLSNNDNLSDKKKKKIEKKIVKMKKGFSHIAYDEKLKMEIFFNSWGNHIIVDYENKKVMQINSPPLSKEKANLYSFFLAYFILFLAFIIIIFLGVFEVIENRYVMASTLVMNLASIILNIWNMYDGRKYFAQLKYFYLLLLPIVILFNLFNLINNISDILSSKF
jgi:hypothetical protein